MSHERTPFELIGGYWRGFVDIGEQYRCHKTLSPFRDKMDSIGGNWRIEIEQFSIHPLWKKSKKGILVLVRKQLNKLNTFLKRAELWQDVNSRGIESEGLNYINKVCNNKPLHFICSIWLQITLVRIRFFKKAGLYGEKTLFKTQITKAPKLPYCRFPPSSL